MTPNFEQEAERLFWIVYNAVDDDCTVDIPEEQAARKQIAQALRAAYEKGQQVEFERMAKSCDIEQKEMFRHGFEACREAAAKVVCKRCAEGRPLRGDCHQWNEHDWAMCLALSIRGALTATNADKPEGK